MAEPSYSAQGRTSDGDPVRIAQETITGLWQIAGWDGFEAAVVPPLAALGLTFPPDFRTVGTGADTGGDARCWRTAPDRILIQTDGAVPSSPDLAVLDLSNARIRLSISGAGASGLLMRVVPVDLSLEACPVGAFVQTGIHHAGVLIERLAGDRFGLLVPRSWAESIHEILLLQLPVGKGPEQ